eukprot:6528753-Ditylum_brightwellii.AAC.1
MDTVAPDIVCNIPSGHVDEWTTEAYQQYLRYFKFSSKDRASEVRQIAKDIYNDDSVEKVHSSKRPGKIKDTEQLMESLASVVSRGMVETTTKYRILQFD